MPTILLTLVLLGLASAAYHLGRGKALSVSADGAPLHSLPRYHGYYVALWCGLPALALLVAWTVLEPQALRALMIAALPPELRGLSSQHLSLVVNEVRNVALHGAQPSSAAVAEAARHYTALSATGSWLLTALCAALAVAGLSWGRSRIHADARMRNAVERVVGVALVACSTVAILTTIGIVLSLIFESLLFFEHVPLHAFLFGTEWSPQMAIRADQVGSSGAFGAVPLFAGTLLISAIALAVAVPLGLLSAIYMSEYAQPRFRAVAKPLLEILAGIPTVVYGFFAVLTISPFLRAVGARLGLGIEAESALAAGLVMGIMIIPFVSSLSDDVINAVPQSLREGALGLGATRSETVIQVVIPAALPGIIGGVLLAASRAIGETMIVVMAAGMAANLTANPFAAVTTVTVQIVTLLVGDQEFDSPKTLAAFALGLVLFCVTLALNIVALHIVNKYREKYD
ncbi:ABC-type phosphate transport system [Paramagnetospirillum caucaseum]|uniref:Phosphate transport system permease protein n=1 Tax=Paramagnetospirillum caucaseum TaxID=1244869 RepID=M3AHD0_9PROT|nr:phosphate ABC transporter permease subunit PstC [Paramagnetospirillum caucaseum]EME71964.1 ABC-type phosphate transport system [Paramagnetospirillum caucaseum]